MPDILDMVEGKRGCGYRKPGGLYLRTDAGLGRPCGKLPVEVTKCPCCGGGIKPARGWTWVDGDKLVGDRICDYEGDPNCDTCPFHESIGRAGLVWIGEKFYAKPVEFMKEADGMGVSRRITAVPKDFKLGKTWVLVAHRKALEKECADCGDLAKFESREEAEKARKECKTCKGTGNTYTQAIFHAFLPSRIEYVVKGTETDEELEAMEKRGFTLVRVHKADEPLPMGGIDAEVP